MSDELLERYTARGSERTIDTRAETDEPEDCGSFGWLRGLRDRAIMLELRKKDGNIVAIGYGWIESVEFDPSVGVTLCALGRKIEIKGRNLNDETRRGARLFEGIVRHRVIWIAEVDQATALRASKDATIVDSIE